MRLHPACVAQHVFAPCIANETLKTLSLRAKDRVTEGGEPVVPTPGIRSSGWPARLARADIGNATIGLTD